MNFNARNDPPDSSTNKVNTLDLPRKYCLEYEEMQSSSAILRVILIEEYKFIKYGTNYIVQVHQLKLVVKSKSFTLKTLKL